MRFESWVLELLIFTTFVLMLKEGRAVLNRKQVSIFLWGSILWTGIIENAFVLLGGYDYYGYSGYYAFGGKVIKQYAGYSSWILVVPLAVCLGWFIQSLPVFIISDRLCKNGTSIWIKSALAAIILVSYDLVQDPLSVVNEWWRWTSPSAYINGVPVANYVGWFFLLFFFAGIYEKTVILQKGFSWLKGVENRIFKFDTMDLSDKSYRKIAHVFYFRLLVYLPLMSTATIATSLLVNLLFLNNTGPFDSVFPNSWLMLYLPE